MADSLVSLITIICCFVFSILTIPRGVYADARTDLILRSCGKYNATKPEILRQEYSSVVGKMREDMRSNEKFATIAVDAGDEKLYMMSQCMDDLSNAECETCFDQIKLLLETCFPANGGRVYLDGCFARFEIFNFFDEVSGPADSKRCGIDTEPEKGFKYLVDDMIGKMVKEAPGKEGFVERQANKQKQGLSAYGMASCWKTLDQQSCAHCLQTAASSALTCLPAIEGRALIAGCYLRYSYYEFANSISTGKPMAGEYTRLMYLSYFIYALVVFVSAIGVGFYFGKMAYTRKVQKSLKKGTELDLAALYGTLHFLQFKYSTIDKATQSFSEANKLGRGGFGEVFKGTLHDGREIAIKRLYRNTKSEIKELRELCSHMNIIGRAYHKNLVRFIGCCITTTGESNFVFEYLPNKSLDRILFDLEEKKKLDWKTRLRIIIGTAEGLEYLHNSCDVRIIHRDIKPSNILLDLKYKPKIADFGLARFYSEDNNIPVNTGIAGTFGYMAPEYITHGQLTEKVDVYSFGVLVLEIISGLQNNTFQPENYYETLVISVWKHFQSKTVSEIIDTSMEKGEENIEEIKRIVCVGLLCTQESPIQRPKMKEVVKMLKEEEMTLPIPSKPPFTEESMELEGPYYSLKL